MAGFDRTGPYGEGPQTGRRKGLCATGDKKDLSNSQFPKGRARRRRVIQEKETDFEAGRMHRNRCHGNHRFLNNDSSEGKPHED